MYGQSQFPTRAPVLWDFDARTVDFPRLTAMWVLLLYRSGYLMRSVPYWERKRRFVGAAGRVSLFLFI